ncbi:LTA synthase family protein [Parageobacillus thermoglucosidasius]|uniref:LTA synthase family protein n=1 Tax=Parageobacillus thermoglucosidasius TaxID=1426 RepID=UPI0027F0C99C|nr:LTA synthase family protein [Parageobacillus thermoglucosidasius]
MENHLHQIIKFFHKIMNFLKKEKYYIILLLFMFFKTVLFHMFTKIEMNKGAIMTTVGIIVVIYSLTSFFSSRAKKIVLYIFNVFLSLVLLIDILYFNYFGTPITVYTFYQINNLSGLGGSIYYLFNYTYLFLFIDLFFIIKWVFIKRENSNLPYKVGLMLLSMGLLIVLVKPIKLMYIDKKDNPFRTFDALDLVKNYGIFGHHMLDTYFAVKDLNQELSINEIKKIDKWFKEKNKNQSNTGVPTYFSFGKDKNLIIIQVESLQNFVINQKINGQEITPTINKILKNSIYFPNFYPQTIHGNSSDAELLTQTSLFPIDRGSVYFRFPNNKYYFSLPYLLKRQGYYTLAIHGDEGTFWNRNQVYPNMGFDKFITIDDFKQDEMIGMGLGDKSMFKQSLKILERAKQPFYSFIITLTNHVPFDIPSYEKKLTIPNELKDTNLGNYLQSVRYTDEAIKLFIEGLKKKNMLQNSIIILYGDHNGIFYKDKNQLEEWLKKPINDEEWIRNYMRVPFIIYNPNIPGKTIETIGGQIDVLPTISYLMGLEKESTQFTMGHNLFGVKKEESAVIIPKGDYFDKSIYLTSTTIYKSLDKEQQEALEISNLIIKGNYFNHKDGVAKIE